ncbi:unnamed protein product, partial [Didymodactylos carnosus]
MHTDHLLFNLNVLGTKQKCKAAKSNFETRNKDSEEVVFNEDSNDDTYKEIEEIDSEMNKDAKTPNKRNSTGINYRESENNESDGDDNAFHKNRYNFSQLNAYKKRSIDYDPTQLSWQNCERPK